MNTENKRVNLLLLLEILALVVVIVLVIMTKVSGTGNQEPQGHSSQNEVVGSENTEGSSDTEGTSNDKGDTTGISVPDSYTEERIAFSDSVEAKLTSMSTEEKVAQLFIVTPEQLTGYDQVTMFGAASQTALDQYPVGGFVYSSLNMESAAQTQALLVNAQEYNVQKRGVQLFTAIEDKNRDMADLKEYGFNLMLTTVADVARFMDTEYSQLTFGTDAVVVADKVSNEVQTIETTGLMSTLKYFPGKAQAKAGNNGVWISYESLEDLNAGSLLSYQAGIDAGATFVMVGNVIIPSVTGDDTVPCSLSNRAVGLLRKSMGFQGVLITDNFSEENFVSVYGSAEGCVKAINAGMDMIYKPADFVGAYTAILEAVNNGTISVDRLNNAVGRILTAKGV